MLTRDVEKLEFSCIASENLKCCGHSGQFGSCSKGPTIGPGNFTPRYIPKRNDKHVHTKKAHRFGRISSSQNRWSSAQSWDDRVPHWRSTVGLWEKLIRLQRWGTLEKGPGPWDYTCAHHAPRRCKTPTGQESFKPCFPRGEATLRRKSMLPGNSQAGFPPFLWKWYLNWFLIIFISPS